MANTRQSEAVQEKKDAHTGTSSSKNSLNGEKDSTNKQPERLLVLNEELANLLALYSQAGGSIFGLTVPDAVAAFGSEHVIVLPAIRIGNSYSLREIGVDVAIETESKGNNKTKKAEKKQAD